VQVVHTQQRLDMIRTLTAKLLCLLAVTAPIVSSTHAIELGAGADGTATLYLKINWYSTLSPATTGYWYKCTGDMGFPVVKITNLRDGSNGRLYWNNWTQMGSVRSSRENTPQTIAKIDLVNPTDKPLNISCYSRAYGAFTTTVPDTMQVPAGNNCSATVEHLSFGKIQRGVTASALLQASATTSASTTGKVTISSDAMDGVGTLALRDTTFQGEIYAYPSSNKNVENGKWVTVNGSAGIPLSIKTLRSTVPGVYTGWLTATLTCE